MLSSAFFVFAVVSAVNGLDLDNIASRLGHNGCQDLLAALTTHDNDDNHVQASSDNVPDDNQQCLTSLLELTGASDQDDIRRLERDVEDHQKYLKRRRLENLEDQLEEYDEDLQIVELKHSKKRDLDDLDDQSDGCDEDNPQEVGLPRKKRSYIDVWYNDQLDYEEDSPQYEDDYVIGHKRSLGGERDWFVVTSTGFILVIFVSLAINSTLLLALGGNINLCFMSGKKPKPIEMNCVISEYDSKTNQVLEKLDIRAEVPRDANLVEAMEKQLDKLRLVNPVTSVEG